jgi:hypothetical protein
MYVVTGGETYAKISSLHFAPETDVVSAAVPVNQFVVDITTDDEIVVGNRIALYDDLDNLWAKYWVYYADRKDKYTVTVTAQSAVKQLERDMLPPAMYDSTLVSEVLPTILARLGGEYTLAPEFATATISGYCPEQTARNRFQWICLCIGAYVKDFFNDRLEILPVSDDAQMIQASQTYWKPTVKYGEYVTAVRAYYYSYSEQTPSTTDEWVEVDGHYYVRTETQVTLRNVAAPPSALENIKTVRDVTLVNQANVDDILTNMALYYFRRTEAEFDAIDNGELTPGQRVTVLTDGISAVTGYITRCTFSFGTQAKASIELTAADDTETEIVDVVYMWDETRIGRRRFRFPVGYEYEIENDVIELVHLGHRYAFIPEEASVSGTVEEGGNVHYVDMEVALDFCEGDLYIRSVSDIEREADTLTIG